MMIIIMVYSLRVSSVSVGVIYLPIEEFSIFFGLINEIVEANSQKK